MKIFQHYLKTGMLLLLFVAGSWQTIQAQQTRKEKQAAKAAEVKKLVESQNYLFVAQTALPMGGRSRQITPDYDLRIGNDTIVSYLPYFGRAYVAPIDPSKSGLMFTSSNFEYTVNEGKKGGWEILIKPKDVQEVQSMQLSITESGYAYLQVQSTNRQPITFNGYVREKKVVRKKK